MIDPETGQRGSYLKSSVRKWCRKHPGIWYMVRDITLNGPYRGKWFAVKEIAELTDPMGRFVGRKFSAPIRYDARPVGLRNEGGSEPGQNL